jgi:hypothetical protein
VSTRAWLELERGVAVLGSVTVPCVAAGSEGDVCVDGGVVLRPVSFEARTQAAWRAGLEPDPAAAVAASLLALQTVRPAPLQPHDDVVSLVLAGAGDEGSSFRETLTTAMQATGLAVEELMSAPACRVDAVARQAHGRDRGAGWTSIIFADPAGTVDWSALRSEFASRLLQRIRERTDVADVDAVDGDTADLTAIATRRPGVHRIDLRAAAASMRASTGSGGTSGTADEDAELRAAPVPPLTHEPSAPRAARVRLVGASLVPPRQEGRPSPPDRLPRLRRAALDGDPDDAVSGVASSGGLRVTGHARAAQSALPSSPAAAIVTASAVAPGLRSLPQPAPGVSSHRESPAAVHAAIASSTAMPAAPVRTLSVTAGGIELASHSAAAATRATTAMADLADVIAGLLNREADLRGID